jgi:hypothetical protein
MRNSKKVEGYWIEGPTVIEMKSSSGFILRKEIPAKTNYTTPITNVLSETEEKEIYRLITEKENTANCYGYMGTSKSRITEESLGNNEYELDGWIWPGDFAEHYILTHKVRPTDEFLKWIGYDI